MRPSHRWHRRPQLAASPAELMIQRRSLLISGAATALGALIGGRANVRARASTPQTSTTPRGIPLTRRQSGHLDRARHNICCPDLPLRRRGWDLGDPRSVTEQLRYFSGHDHERAVELSRAWTDPNIETVISLDGGWDSARVLEAGFHFPRRPKWSLGFSESSSLLLAQWSAGLPGAIDGSTSGPAEQWQRIVALLKELPVAPLDGRGLVQGIGEAPSW